MRKIVACILLLSLLNLLVLPAVPSAKPAAAPRSEMMRSPIPDTVNSTSDWAPNPGFENWYSPTNTYDWSEATTGDTYSWYAEAPWPIKNGSRSAGLQAYIPIDTGGATYTYVSPYLSYFKMGALNLTFWWYSDQTQNTGHDNFHARFDIHDGVYYRSLMYYLNRTSSLSSSNQTTSGFIDAGGPTQQWNRFSRNITADYEAIPGWGTVTAAHEVYNIEFYLGAFGDTAQVNRGFIDAVVLENATTTLINSTIRNGDFETSDDWSFHEGESASYISRSTTAHSGTYACNMTSQSNGNESTATLSCSYARPRITSQNQGLLSFMWYLDLDSATATTQAYLYFYIRNGTNSQHLYYMFGYGGTTSPIVNSSSNLVLLVESFNTTGSWVNCSRNLWQDAHAYFGTDELSISTIYWNSRCHDSGSRTSLLFDEVHLTAWANNGRDFEDQRAIGERIRGLSSDYDVFRVTGTAYAGSKAANLTLANGAGLAARNYLGYRAFSGSRDTCLDVMWNLQDYTPSASDFAYIRIDVRGTKSLIYYLAYAAGQLPANSTNSAYFAVSGANTIDSWVQMHRDLSTDYEAVFGSRPDTDLYEFEVHGYTSGSNRLELLFDDLYIYDRDGSAPYISGVTQFPAAPAYTQVVVVTATAVDPESGVSHVAIHVRINNGSWEVINMTHLGGGTYQGIIAALPINTLVEYYIKATNIDTVSRIANDRGEHYQYLVSDILIPLTSLLLGSVVVIIVVVVVLLLWFYVLRKRLAKPKPRRRRR